MEYREQTDRIRQKLAIARAMDKGLEAFGANSHRYVLGRPALNVEIKVFETKYSIELPSCYKAFLTEIGNGGIAYPNSVTGNSGAGPNYGIYKLENGISVLADASSGYLKEKAFFYSGVKQSEWSGMYATLDEDISDEDFDKYVEKVYAGILTIGFCGCSGYQGIMLNGDEKGRVVYLYDDLEYCPHFAEELNFLDWYENWLDKTINVKYNLPEKKWWKIWQKKY